MENRLALPKFTGDIKSRSSVRTFVKSHYHNKSTKELALALGGIQPYHIAYEVQKLQRLGEVPYKNKVRKS